MDLLSPPAGLRVLVVGAGVSGLATANALSCSEVIVIERQDDIGGIWHQYRYPGLRLHTTTNRYAYPDSRSTDPDLRSTREAVKQYLERYWGRCRDRVPLYLRTELLAVDERQGVLSCTIRRSGGGVEAWLCTHVVLACMNQPRMPVPYPLPGVIHCSEATEEVLNRAQGIVLVGAGKAACDLIVYLTPTHVRPGRPSERWLLWTAREGSFLWFADRSACISGEWFRRYCAAMSDGGAEAVDGLLQVLHDPAGFADRTNLDRTRCCLAHCQRDHLLNARGAQLSALEYETIRHVECVRHRSLEYGEHLVIIDSRRVECDLCVCCTGTAKMTLPLNGLPLQDQLGNECLLRGMLDPEHPQILLLHPFNFSPSVKMAWLNAQWIAHYICRGEALTSPGIDPKVEGWHWYWEGRQVGNLTQPDPLDGWWPRLNAHFSRQVLDDLEDWAPSVVQMYREDCDEMDKNSPTAEEMEAFDALIYRHLHVESTG